MLVERSAGSPARDSPSTAGRSVSAGDSGGRSVVATRLAQVGNHQGVTSPSIDRLGAQNDAGVRDHERPHPDQAGPGLRLRQDRARRARPRRWPPPASSSSRPVDPPRGSPTLGVPVTKVEDLTGFPECLDGRVKTLHPTVHAGILADRRLESHARPARRARHRAVRPGRLQPLPVRRRPSTSGASPDECVEQIDIGGPSMVRAAAKNHPSVAIVTSPDALRRRARGGGGRRLHPRRSASGSRPRRSPTPRRTTSQVASWMGNVLTDTSDGTGFPAFDRRDLGQRQAVLRYGENPHQPAALYAALARRAGRGRAAARQGDVLQQLRRHRRGAARRQRLRRAGGGDHQARQPVRHRDRRRRRRGAPQGARVRPGVGVRRRDRGQPAGVGGDGRAGRRGLHRGDRGAGLRGRRRRGPAGARRTSGILRCPSTSTADPIEFRGDLRRRARAAGRTTSTPPATTRRPGRWRPARPRRTDVLADLAFAWRACRAVKSNAILLAHDGASVGVGMGQVNRVDSCRLAVSRAGERAAGSVAASDAFFPFADGPAGPDRRRGPCDRAARRVDARRADRRGLPGRRRDHVLHRHPHFAH